VTDVLAGMLIVVLAFGLGQASALLLLWVAHRLRER
jgi:hypothetical protein